MAIEYNFKYMPLVGKLSGESMVRQTETAINEIAQIVNDNTAQAEIINTLAETANANSVEALEKANEALDTSSRVYIKETLAVDLDNYCESQLIYVNNTASQNLPVAHKGFLEVKTNDDKTQATQVFADDVDGKFYVRTGEITANTVGDVTTYTASYGGWVDIPNITDLDNYLALTGGTMSGDIEFSAREWKIKGSDIDNDAELSIVGATDNLNGSSLNLYGRNHAEGGAFELNANNGTYTKTLKGDASGNLKWDGNSVAIAKDFLPLSGGTVTGSVIFNARAKFKSSIDFFDEDAEHGRIYDLNNVFRITGGTNTSDGSYIDLSYTGGGTQQFRIVANDGTTQKLLVGNPDGTLSWAGNDVITSAGGTLTGNLAVNKQFFEMTNTTLNGRNSIFGGTNSNNGAFLFVYGKDHSNAAGNFVLHASDGTNTSELIGRPDGTLTWNDIRFGLGNGTYDLTFYSFGYLTASATALNLSFPYIAKNKDIRFNSLSATLRSYKGYLSPGGIGGGDILTGSTQGTWYKKNTSYPCVFRLVRSDGWGANGENNTLVVGELTANVTVTDA